MNTAWKDLKGMMLSEKANLKRLTLHDSKYSILTMTKLCKQRTDQWLC